MIERFNRRINEVIASKAKIANNSGKNSFNSHDERNEFIHNFVNSYNNTRLLCLGYQAPLYLLNSNLTEYNITHVLVDPDRKNIAAIKTYEKAGFKIIQENN